MSTIHVSLHDSSNLLWLMAVISPSQYKALAWRGLEKRMATEDWPTFVAYEKQLCRATAPQCVVC